LKEKFTRDMLISPFANDEIISSISTNVVYLVVVVAEMLYENFFTRPFGSVYSHIYDVVT